jgi:hypothetical protein
MKSLERELKNLKLDNLFFRYILALFIFAVHVEAGCDKSLENPHALACGGFSMSIDGFDSPCCSYDDANSFDSWNTYRDIDDRNISTAIVDVDVDLTLASLNDANDDYKEFNGTVCARVVATDDETNTKSAWVKSIFEDENTTTITLHAKSAYEDSTLFIKWHKDKNESETDCDDDLDDKTTSTDNFAIRPKEFFIKLSSENVKAAEKFKISFIAGKDENTPAKDYNKTQADKSFEVKIAENKSTCIEGDFDPDITKEVDFEDGNKTFDDVSYGEIGYINLKITEESVSCSKRYAKVDCDDKNISGSWSTQKELLITQKDKNITVVPFEFKVTLSSSNHADKFTYIANEIDKISAKLDINITAKNKDGNTTKNYNKSCYANDTDITLKYDSLGDSNIGDFIYFYKNIDEESVVFTKAKNDDVDFELSKDYFRDVDDENGSAIFEMHYNFGRVYYKPTNPFDMNITKFEVEDSTDASVSGYSDSDGVEANFCFGRVKTKDIKTTIEGDINHNIEIVVYDSASSDYTNDLKLHSLKWYKHKHHTSAQDGNVSAIDATSNTILKDIKFSLTNIDSPNNGDIRVVIPQNKGTYILHKKTDPWLWYGIEKYTNDYNASEGSSCISHPCFNYILKEKGSDYISTGSYRGGNIKLKDRGSVTKKGVKVFR